MFRSHIFYSWIRLIIHWLAHILSKQYILWAKFYGFIIENHIIARDWVKKTPHFSIFFSLYLVHISFPNQISSASKLLKSLKLKVCLHRGRWRAVSLLLLFSGQVIHLFTYAVTSLFTFGRKYLQLINSYLLAIHTYAIHTYATPLTLLAAH